MSMRMCSLAVLCVLSVWCVGAVSTSLPSDGVLSSTILTGPVFTITGVNNTDNDLTGHSIVLVTNPINGTGTAVPLNGPELRVVANTTVYFALTGFWPANAVSTYSYPAGFGLTSSSSSTAGQRMSGDAVGLTPTPASVSAGSCYSYIENDSSASGYVQPNTFALNYTVNFSATDTGFKTYSTTPCVLQWQVPANATGANATNYYYFEPFTPSTPRRIYIVASDPNTPSTGTGSGSGSGGSNNSTSSPTTAAPTTSSPTTGAPTPSGTGSSSPTPAPNGTSSSTGSKPPSSAFASAHVSAWAALVAVLATISAAATAL